MNEGNKFRKNEAFLNSPTGQFLLYYFPSSPIRAEKGFYIEEVFSNVHSEHSEFQIFT